MPIARDYAYALMATLTSLVLIGAVQVVSEAAQNDKNTDSSKASDTPIIEPSSQPSAVNVRCSAGDALRTTLSTGSQAAMTVSCAPA